MTRTYPVSYTHLDVYKRQYLYLAHRARRMERRLAGAVTAGGVAGAVAGSTISNGKATRNTATKSSRGNTCLLYTSEAYASHLQEHGKFLVTEHGIFELPE